MSDVKMVFEEMWCENMALQGPAAGCCGHGHEPAGFPESGEFLDYPCDCWFLKDFARNQLGVILASTM